MFSVAGSLQDTRRTGRQEHLINRNLSTMQFAVLTTFYLHMPASVAMLAQGVALFLSGLGACGMPPTRPRSCVDGGFWRYSGAIGKIWRLYEGRVPTDVRECHASLMLKLRSHLLPHSDGGHETNQLLDML